MKRTAKLLAILLVLMTVASTISAFAFGSNLTADDYDEYGYYTYYDFESYTGGHPLSYFRKTATKNANGLLSDPFGFICQGQGNTGSTATAVTEDGNTYVHYTHVNGSYNCVAVFETIDANGNDAILNNATELSFRLRMSANQAASDTKMALIKIRRNGDNITYVQADVYGNLYVQTATDEALQVYTNGNGKTIGGDGKFMDISFIWFDTTNCFSLYVDGNAVAEGIPFYTNYISDAKVTRTYDDNFNLSGATITGNISTDGGTRTIEFIRPDVDVAFQFDLDDLKLSRYETAQKGAIYYENGFESAVEGISRIKPLSTYIYYGGETKNGVVYPGASTSNIKLGYDKTEDNGYLEVSNGQYVALNDRYYQAFLQTNTVVEFSVKGKVNLTSGYAGLVRFNDSYCRNMYKPVVVDKDGYLYLYSNYSSGGKTYDFYDRIDGYKINENEWLDIAIVAIKNTDNYGKFGTFSATSVWDNVKDNFFFACYVNGNFVGSTMAFPYSRFSGNNYNNLQITASGFKYTITDHTDVSALNLDSYTLLTTHTSKSGDVSYVSHKIYKSVVNGVTTYYDVNYDVNGNATKYSAMILGEQAADDENIRIFTDTYFDAKLDNLKIYEGTAPASAYEAANASNGGTVLSVDFSKFAFPSGQTFDARTHSSGSSVLGTFITSGFKANNSIHKDANGNAITAATALNSNYSTLSFTAGPWFDYYVPMPDMSGDKFDFIYSFQTSVKNFTFDTDTAPADISLMNIRLENDQASNASALIKINKDLNIFIGNTSNALYGANGKAIKLDNNNWNSLRVDVRFTKTASGKSLMASFFYNDKPLYLADGSIAANITSIFSANAVERVGVSNVRLRYMPQLGTGKTLSYDAKNLTVTSKPMPTYVTVSGDAKLNENVSVIEFNLNKYTGADAILRYDAVSIVKNGETMPLVALDPTAGNVYVGFAGNYYKLYNKNYNEIKVRDEALPIKIVYDDISGDARYYVNDTLAYVSLNNELVPASDLVVYSYDFANLSATGASSFLLFSGYGENDRAALSAEDYSLTSYNIGKRDTARLIGFQISEKDKNIRLVAGLDNFMYDIVGVEIETFVNGASMGKKELTSAIVFESIQSTDGTISAESQGYKALATAIVTDTPTTFSDNTYIEIRSFAEIGGERHYDEKAKIVLLDGGYYFDKDGTIYQSNFNGATGLPAEWKLAGNLNGKASVTTKGELEFIQTENDKTFLYLNQYVGEEYLFQFDMTISDVTPNIGAYLAPMFGYNSAHTYGCATVRAQVHTPQGQIQYAKNNNWTYPDEGIFTLNELGGLLETGKPYTVSIAAKKTATGTNIAFFIDGKLVKQYSFDGYDNKGFVGICSKGVSMLIDNVIVKTGEYAEAEYFNYTKSFKDDTTLPSEWTAVDTHAQGIVEITNTSALRVTSSGDALPQLYLKNLTATDYVVEANITMRDNSNSNGYFGIVVRATKTGTDAGTLLDSINCAFRVGGHGGWIQGDNTANLTPSNAAVIAPGTPFVNGQTYNFKVECNGKTIKFYLDGTLVGTGTIPAGASKYDTGTIGFAGKRVIFDVEDVKVTALDGTLLYEEDFDNNTNLSDNWRMLIPNGSNFNIGITESENKLAIKETLSGKYITQAVLDPEKVSFSDYTVSADFTITANSNYFGITARYSPTSTSKKFVLAAIRQNGTGFIESMEDGNWVPKSAYTFNLGRELTIGEIYNLKVICEGNQIYFYIDGVEVAKGEIPAGFEEGTVGVASKGSCIEVDNFKVSKDIELFEIVDAENPTTRIRVATFNIGDFSTGSGSSGDGIAKGNGTEATKAEYRAVFEKVGADIWGLQEDSEYFNGTTKETPYNAIYSAVHTNYERNFTGSYNGKAFLTSFDIYDVEPIYYNKIYTSYSPDKLVGFSHAWFLTGKILVDGKEIHIATLHFEWSCKELRFQQIRDVLNWAKDKEYCIILGDFNPENYVNGVKVQDPNDEHYVNGFEYVNMYQVDWKFFTDAGFEAANGGRFGAFETLVANGNPRGGYPWDNIFVSSNIKIVNAQPVYEKWMCDHAIFVADIEIN